MEPVIVIEDTVAALDKFTDETVRSEWCSGHKQFLISKHAHVPRPCHGLTRSPQSVQCFGNWDWCREYQEEPSFIQHCSDSGDRVTVVTEWQWCSGHKQFLISKHAHFPRPCHGLACSPQSVQCFGNRDWCRECQEEPSFIQYQICHNRCARRTSQVHVLQAHGAQWLGEWKHIPSAASRSRNSKSQCCPAAVWFSFSQFQLQL